MKRYFILCLLLALLLPCMVVPASASQWGSDDVEDIISSVQTIESDLYSWFEQWYAYFFEATETINDVSGAESLVTPFKYDLIQAQMYVWSWISGTFDSMNTTLNSIKTGLANIYGRINTYWPQWDTDMYNFGVYLKSLKDNLDLLKNYFSVADEKIIKYEYSYADSGFTVDFEEVSVTSFIADLHILISPLENLLFEIFGGDYSHSSDIDDEVSADQTEASEILDVLDDVTKPDEGELEDLADISGYVDSSDVTALADVFKPLFESAVFLPCIMLNLTFMLVGYVLFGKR